MIMLPSRILTTEMVNCCMAAVLIVTQTEATVDSLFKDTYKIQSTEATSNLIFICMNFFQKKSAGQTCHHFDPVFLDVKLQVFKSPSTASPGLYLAPFDTHNIFLAYKLEVFDLQDIC